MRCPKCYGGIDKRNQVCKHCGFRLKSMEGATHKAVKQAKKDGFGMDIMYTDKLPVDLSKKKLLILCIFLGLFGGHSFYAGKPFKAIYSLCSGVINTVIAILIAVLKISVTILLPVYQWIYSISLLCMGINLMLWVFDLIAIIRNKYKVSVYKDEFSDY